VPQCSHAKCGRLGAWHCGHSTVVTALSFQFAARRLRVLLRGVFHFRFATYSVSVVHVHAPVFLFSPQLGQMPLQSGPHSKPSGTVL
jgi:hypothetical protein